MLRVIAYDIADPRRLQRVALTCEDYGLRIQYSVFECWLDDATFQQLWAELVNLISKKDDRLVVYVLDSAAAKRRLTAGDTMVLSQKARCYYY